MKLKVITQLLELTQNDNVSEIMIPISKKDSISLIGNELFIGGLSIRFKDIESALNAKNCMNNAKAPIDFITVNLRLIEDKKGEI